MTMDDLSERKRRKAGVPKRKPIKAGAFTVSIEVYDRDRGMYVTVHRKGRLFDVEGRNVLVFTPKVFTEAIDRKLWTLASWEKQGLIPVPVWTIDNGKKTRRLYSKGQVLFANELWKKYRHQGKGRHFDLTAFLTELHAGFYKSLLDDDKDRPVHAAVPMTLPKEE